MESSLLQQHLHFEDDTKRCMLKNEFKSHLPNLIFRAGRSDISGPERGADHSTALIKLIGVSSTYQILKFAYVFIHAVGWPAPLYSPPKRCEQHPKQAVSAQCLIAGASTTICTRFISRAAPLCPNLEGTLCPTLTAHLFDVPFITS